MYNINLSIISLKKELAIEYQNVAPQSALLYALEDFPAKIKI